MNDTLDKVVFGPHPVEELVSSGSRQIDRIYFDNAKHTAGLFALMKRCRKDRIPYQVVPTRKLDDICGTTKHQGVVAICPAKEFAVLDEILNTVEGRPSPPLLLLPASVEDPRNLGSIIRSAAAFGVDAVILERKNTVPLNATVARTSAGMLEHVAVVKPRNLEREIGALANRGYGIVGATTGADRRADSVDMRGPTVVITGGEDRDLPPYLRKLCTNLVRIPAVPGTASLNVSVAAALILYECSRQRGFEGASEPEGVWQERTGKGSS